MVDCWNVALAPGYLLQAVQCHSPVHLIIKKHKCLHYNQSNHQWTQTTDSFGLWPFVAFCVDISVFQHAIFMSGNKNGPTACPIYHHCIHLHLCTCLHAIWSKLATSVTRENPEWDLGLGAIVCKLLAPLFHTWHIQSPLHLAFTHHVPFRIGWRATQREMWCRPC